MTKAEQFCLQRHGGVCLHIGTGCPHSSRYLFSKGGTNRAFALEWKDTTGSEWYCLLWVTWRELQCCAILFPKLDFLKVAFIVWFSYLSQQLQSAGIAQELSDPTAQQEVCKTLLVPWSICVFTVSGWFFPNPQLQLCHCSWGFSSCPVTAGLQPPVRLLWRVGGRGRVKREVVWAVLGLSKRSFSLLGGIQRLYPLLFPAWPLLGAS